MHAQKMTQSDPSNPHIHIMFNINSKNVVNNNILSDRQKQLNFDLSKGMVVERAVQNEKKTVHENRAKNNRSAMSKVSPMVPFNTRQDISSEEGLIKPKKKAASKQTNNNITVNESHRSSKNTVHKKNTSQGFSKLTGSQQGHLSQKKHLTKSKSKLKQSTIHKDTRDTIIQLMIRDYERGSITADNLKEAISSLIDKETQDKKLQQKRLLIKTASRSDKARTRITTSYKNSLAASLHNTPKHKPSKSKSQKFHYHSQQPSLVLKMKELQEEPQIIERVIHNKEFMSKIVIKGINSSLFLSNDWTEKESPLKEDRGGVHVNVINTSDSVRDLRKEMIKVVRRQDESRENTNEHSLLADLPKIVQNKQKETKNILANFIEQLKGSVGNEFLPSGQVLRRQKSVSSSQNSLKYLTRLKENNNFSQNNDLPQNEEQHNSLDDFYVKEHDGNPSESDCSRIQELQKQYALLLKDKQSESRNESSLPNQSVEQYRQEFTAKIIPQHHQQLNNSPKIKSYVSSELQNSVPLSEVKQQMTQKRAKSITQSQIKKLSQIMEVIKEQLDKKQSTSTNGTKDSEVLEKIVSLLETEKQKVQQELKLYGEVGLRQVQLKRVTSENGSSRVQNGKEQRIEQNQIINSFQKKLKKLNVFDSSNQQAHEDKHKIYFESNSLKSLSSSRKSISSNGSSHHLQKIKISQLNLDQIQLGLRKRLNDLEARREHEYSIITEKFINDKISPKQYQEEKEIIEKWFEVEVKELKRTKQNLLQGYRKAKDVIDKSEFIYESRIEYEKSAKMIKCISEKYLNKIVAEEKEDGLVQQKRQNKAKKHTNSQKEIKKFTNRERHYQTIEEMQEELLVRNITPIEKFLCVQREEMDVLSPLSMQESGTSQEKSINLLNNSNEMTEVLMTLQECENGSSEEVVIRNKRPNTDNGRVSGQRQTAIYEYEETKSKRPHSAKINCEIAHYLSKYEGSSDQKSKGMHDQSKETDQNCSQDNSRTQYLEEYGDDEADNEESSNDQEYHGYNDTEQGQVGIYKSLLKKNELLPSQESLTSSEGLSLEQPTSTIVNKAPLDLDEIFSPKKPIVHEQFSEQLLQYNSTQANHQKASLEFAHLNKQFNQTFLKLKYLTDEDKDDIFEFMFLDLCLELFLEQTKNNKIMKTIERFLVGQRRRKKIPKGFKTGLDTCRLYVGQIQQFLQQNHFKTLKRLQSPMGPSAKEMLKFMRDYEDMESSESQIETVNLVLPIQIYQKFQSQPVNKLQVQRYYDDDEKEESRLKFLKSLKHFHNKAMFDSLNEMLDVQRCYGIWGKPFPWKKALDVDRKFTDQQINKKLKNASDKLLQNCSYFCGVLTDKEESVFGKNNVSEEYLHHIRQDRMSKMLSNDMIDNEDRWIFYDDEETEVLVSLTKNITADLILQLLHEIKVISWK